jgi:hypothetical protein
MTKYQKIVCTVQMKPNNDYTFYILGRHTKPFSYVKRHDILRVINRLKDHTGGVYISEVYAECRSRIPGSRKRYTETVKLFGKQIR